MTRRESILKDIKSGLAGITVATGYLNTILTSNIHHWRFTAVKDNESLVVNLEDQEAHDYGENGYKEVLRLDVQISVTSASPYAKLSSLVLDIEKYFYNSKSTYKSKYGMWFVKPVENKMGMEISDQKRGTQDISFEIIHRLSEHWKGPDTTNWT